MTKKLFKLQMMPSIIQLNLCQGNRIHETTVSVRLKKHALEFWMSAQPYSIVARLVTIHQHAEVGIRIDLKLDFDALWLDDSVEMDLLESMPGVKMKLIAT